MRCACAGAVLSVRGGHRRGCAGYMLQKQVRESPKSESPAASAITRVKKKRKCLVAGGLGAACRRETKVGQLVCVNQRVAARAQNFQHRGARQASGLSGLEDVLSRNSVCIDRLVRYIGSVNQLQCPLFSCPVLLNRCRVVSTKFYLRLGTSKCSRWSPIPTGTGTIQIQRTYLVLLLHPWVGLDEVICRLSRLINVR